jgi:hypothetical protein
MAFRAASMGSPSRSMTKKGGPPPTELPTMSAAAANLTARS